MNFFNLDRHISLSLDFEYVFNKIGHTVDVKTQSRHSFVGNKKRSDIPLLEGNSWKDIIKNKLWNSFYDSYSKELSKYDGFLVGYPPAYALLYNNFSKPIIVHIAIRYEHPFTFNKNDWEFFNSWLRDKIDNRKITLVANNLYDIHYTKSFLNRDIEYIPSLGAYTGSWYVPNDGPVLYTSKIPIVEMPTNAVWKEEALKGFYSWKDLYSKYKAMIIIPYQVSTMSIFELYTANVPLLFPSKDLLLKLFLENRVLSEVHWNRYYGGDNGSTIGYNCKYDPNNFSDAESIRHWINFADYYNEKWFPHITYFESFEHLKELINGCNFSAIHERIKNFNKDREDIILSLWRKLVNGIFI